MTKDELEVLILKSKDLMKLANAFSGMDEKERRALSTHAHSVHNQLEKHKINKSASPRIAKHIKARKGEVWNHWNAADTINARLAVLALGPLTAVKKLHLSWYQDDGKSMNKILTDRKPEWINEWIEHDLEQEFSSLDFGTIWAWMKIGICDQPKGDGFFFKFANYMQSTGVYGRGPGTPISKALKAEPKLKEYVWSLFKIESDAFNTNSWFKKGAAEDHETWTEALLKMSQAGDLDRQRLLDASLEGLWGDIKQNQLSGFHKFHKSLKPTQEEQIARQSKYLSLLSHSVGHVVKFGLDNASALEKAKSLDADAFLAEIPNVFFQDAKGNAMAAVKLMGRLLKSQPKKSSEILSVLPEALRHPQPDVQNLALGLLEKNGDQIDDNIRESIADAADRLQLAPYIATENDQEKILQDKPTQTIDVGGFTLRQKKTLRINELNKEGPFLYWPISQNILDHEVLSGSDVLEPILDEDELIAAISHAIEIVDTPEDIERIVDGISRLAGAPSRDFADKTAPLLTRIENKANSDSMKGLRYFGNVSAAIMDLIYTWLTRKYHNSPQKKFEKHVTAFIPAALYFKEISGRVRKGQSRQLLTFPTHMGGWIDPLIWVARLVQFEKENIKISEAEISLSVLRLAPDAAAGLGGDLGRLARFALGGDEQPTSKDKKKYGMWVSAGRCRNPYGDLSELLAPLKLKDSWPDGLHPAVYEWRPFVEEQKSHYGDEIYKFSRISIDIKSTNGASIAKSKLVPRLKNPLTTEWERMPSAAPNCRSRQKYFWGSELNAVYLSKLLFYQWPQCPNAAYIVAVEDLMQRVDEDSSSWEPNFGYLDGLFQKNRPWLEPGHLLLCIALSVKDADVRGLAIDAMIEGIEAGSFDVDLGTGVLVKLVSGGWLKLNRLGDNLMTVAETSPLHAWVVGALIQQWLQQVDTKQRYMFRMLEVLLEAQSTVGRALDPKTQEALKTLKGSSKAAKIAKTLLKITDTASSNIDAELKNQALNGRLS